MFIPYNKAQRIDESSCMFVADRDGRTADTEHRRRQQWHIYVVYVPPHALCPWFGKPCSGPWQLKLGEY